VEEEELSPTPSHPKVDMGEGGVSLSVETRGKIPSPSSQGSTGTRPEVDGAFVHSDETQNWSCDYCGTEFQFTAQEVYGGLQCRCETWVSWRDEDGNAVDLIPVDGGKFAVKAREGKS
jgi:hypothetical protein